MTARRHRWTGLHASPVYSGLSFGTEVQGEWKVCCPGRFSEPEVTSLPSKSVYPGWYWTRGVGGE